MIANVRQAERAHERALAGEAFGLPLGSIRNTLTSNYWTQARLYVEDGVMEEPHQ
jgi:hypothetical protein